MNKQVFFLEGPIDSGKTTLGKALAALLCGHFIDGDDHSCPERPWYASSLSTSRAILRVSLEASQTCSVVIVAYPLRRRQWFFFQQRLCTAGIYAHCIGLRATYAAIIGERRKRRFSPGERRRIQTMIAEGYGQRPFSDLIIDTDQADFATTLARLEGKVRELMAGRMDSDTSA